MKHLPFKTVKLSAKYPVKHAKALKQMANDNGRSMASEMRIAMYNHLNNDGRII